MSDVIPPPPPPSIPQNTIFHQMAKVSWVSVLLSFAVNIVTQSAKAGGQLQSVSLWTTGAILLLMFAGTICGIGALFGIPKYGRKGILLPALTGLVIWGLMFAIAIPAFVKARARALEARARKPTTLALAEHAPNAVRFKDEQIGFEFDVPEGFSPAAKEKIPPGVLQLFFRPTGPQSAQLIIVKPLGSPLPRQRLTQAHLPAGGAATLAHLDWRGLEIDAARIMEKTKSGDYVTLNVTVPLKAQAVQIGFGGSADTEAEMRAVADRLLKSLEGESNW